MIPHFSAPSRDSRAVRTLLADDSQRFLAVARRFLTALGLEVIGEARTGREALRLLDTLQPDLLLLDLEMPEADGLTVLRLAKARPVPPSVIVVTLHDQLEFRAAAAEAGADGFVAKRELTTALPSQIHEIFPPVGRDHNDVECDRG
jgi:DNA-binding NarL/FixJ family response regulator